MKKIIVTGATGFVGSHCLDLLKNKNYQVFAISKSKRQDLDNIKWIEADLFNFLEIDSVMKKTQGDTLLHLAWITTPGVFYESLENNLWVESSLNLIEAFLAQGGKKIVIAGSCAEYDWNKKEMMEDEEVSPSSLYGKSKLLLYKEVKKRCQRTNADLAWGRIFNVFGPKEHPAKIIPLIIRAALSNKKIQCLAKDDIRDFIYVKEVANIFLTLMESDFNGIINIATGKGSSIKDLASLIEQRLSVSNICDFKQNFSVFPEVVGNTKNLEKLNYRFKFNLDYSIDETIRWWRDEGRSDL
jgi:nucleoside-diphosphate-sugar epimerase